MCFGRREAKEKAHAYTFNNNYSSGAVDIILNALKIMPLILFQLQQCYGKKNIVPAIKQKAQLKFSGTYKSVII